MSFVGYINASLEIWGCLITLIVAACLMVSRRSFSHADHLYFEMLAANAGVLLADVVALLLRGHAGLFGWWGVRIANFASYAFGYLLLYLFSAYLNTALTERMEEAGHILRGIRILCIAAFCLLTVNLFVPIYYQIDAQNIYHRAPLFWLSQLAGGIGIAMNAWALVRCGSEMERIEKAAFWSFLLMPAAAMAVQSFIYGVVLLNVADTVSLVVIFLLLEARQGRRSAEREKELMQDRVAIMMSQIQPHFLYNALAVIQDMCHDKAPEAEQATIEFSEFLRGNMDSLSADSPIPFQQELHHTENYLYLEKKRFGDRLKAVYEIGTVDFVIPALTLQPIVENAVRYGIMQREDGGTVLIRTKRTEKGFFVTVQDDGIGFDPQQLKDDGRAHIGIRNVRERLHMMVSGTLEIHSEEGKGTTAVIFIPHAKTAEEIS